MSVRSDYEITDAAGEWIAGVRRPIDGRLSLTLSQAAHPLRLGHIRAVKAKKRASGSTPRQTKAKAK